MDPAPRDAFDIAATELRSGARVDATITAIERGLMPCLRALAAQHGVTTTHDDGRPVKASDLNNHLKKASVYPENDRAQVDAWLKDRNTVVHPNGEEITDAKIAAVRVFVAEHPVDDGR